ncbi:interferon-inducible GTPase 5 [Sarcophilus harrisii]|uniref:interferon-inducible GTPase 5 n=1 Tax=Sarcophilus harrisii TaxID=9305 RepID=UPI001301CD0A|nr:interferon-inducible GTPase 5 [Sarcophilus harrisii]
MAAPTTQESKTTLSLSPEKMASIGEVFQGDSLSATSTKLRSTLQSLENVRLDIAITGGAGSGRSTFVNSLRGLGDEDQGSAQTGLAGATSAPTPYPHPKYPNVIVWELPDLGAASLQPEQYLEKVLMGRYDLFILLSAERFSPGHARLARALQARDKPCYLVRSKVDVDVAASRQRRPSTFSEEGVLMDIRENCRSYLQAEGVAKPKVFLLSTFELDKFDFQLLSEVIVRDLESSKRHAFLLALPNVSNAVLEKKAGSMLQHIWLVATVACTVNPLPVPGVPEVACDLGLLVRALSGYRRGLGLEAGGLQRLAQRTGGSLQAMQSRVCGPLCEASPRQVIDFLGRACGSTTATFAQELASLPMLGVLASCSFSFATVYQMLRAYLDKATAEAKKTLSQALPTGQ